MTHLFVTTMLIIAGGGGMVIGQASAFIAGTERGRPRTNWTRVGLAAGLAGQLCWLAAGLVQ